MRVSDVLNRKGHDVVVISPSATVAEFLRLLSDHRIGSTVVVENDQMVGICSERDLVRCLSSKDGDIKVLLVGDIMTSNVKVCHREDDLADLAATMTEHRLRHLPVVDADGQLLGLVSIGDVVKARLEALADERDHLINYVQQ